MVRKVMLIHAGRPVGVAEVNPDDNQIVCTFDIKSMMVREVVELFWPETTDKIEINVFTPIENTEE